jgi:hypothetical protein
VIAILHAVKVKLAKNFNPKQTTLCIQSTEQSASPADGNVVGRARRLKTMQAALSGVPIVSPDWISQCINQKSVSAPSAEQIVRSMPKSVGREAMQSEFDFGIAKLAAAIKSCSSFRLLAGRPVHLLPPFPKTMESDILALLRQAGAKIETNQAFVARLITLQSAILLCCSSSNNISGKLGDAIAKNPGNAMVVNSQWLFDSISCARALDAELYPPENTSGNLKDFWELGLYHE